MRLSLLDRSRTRAGQPEGAALRHTVERAHTTAIRLGSGGVMLPNHQPFVVAEQFLMLASLYPNRVDLGIGRSLGFTAPVRRALRRPVDGPDSFADDVSEVRSFLEATAPVTARPVVTGPLPLFVLATGRGIEVAARLGLPVVLGGPVLARPELGDLLAAYRRDFRPHRSSRPTSPSRSTCSSPTPTQRPVTWPCRRCGRWSVRGAPGSSPPRAGGGHPSAALGRPGRRAGGTRPRRRPSRWAGATYDRAALAASDASLAALLA